MSEPASKAIVLTRILLFIEEPLVDEFDWTSVELLWAWRENSSSRVAEARMNAIHSHIKKSAA
jgi:hypothetical protein